jgi:hypothetical protein
MKRAFCPEPEIDVLAGFDEYLGDLYNAWMKSKTTTAPTSIRMGSALRDPRAERPSFCRAAKWSRLQATVMPLTAHFSRVC